jgi:zinc transporter ZupT
VLAAFGAGALLAALSVELIAPTSMAVTGTGRDDPEARAAFRALILGCVGGGLLYVGLDYLVNRKGGFLRRPSTLLRYYRGQDRKDQEAILERLATIPVFADFPAESIEDLLELLEFVEYEDGAIVFEEGDRAEHVLVLLEGGLVADLGDGGKITAGPSDVAVGLLPMLSHGRFPTTTCAQGTLKALKITDAAFERLRELSPEFDRSCRALAAQHVNEYETLIQKASQQALDWLEASRQSLSEDLPIPDQPTLRRLKQENHGAPLAVWLGILLDGIPESLVIGAGMLGMLTATLATTGEAAFVDVIPFTLVAGLFLSNFPEALSSSANMLEQGWGRQRIFLMWFSLMLITAIGAAVGYVAAGVLDHTWLALFEGLAAGAMLTMIAAAMIPEAVLMGSGNNVGLGTLAGFLAAVLFKLLE